MPNLSKTIALVVFDAEGNWHRNDDYFGANPAVQF